MSLHTDIFYPFQSISPLLLLIIAACFLDKTPNLRDRCGHDLMVAGFTTIITKVVSSNPIHAEEYSIQHYVTKFVSDLRQVGGLLRFPSPIKLTATI